MCDRYGFPGPVVTAGQVTAYVRANGVEHSASTTIAVTDRTTFKWTSADWSYTKGTAPVPAGGDEPNTASGNGHLCPKISCDLIVDGQYVWVQPNFDNEEGYIIAEIPSGPNIGLNYVSSASFKYLTESAIRPGFAATYQTRNVTSGTDLSNCRALANNANIGPYINWYDYNSKCAGLNSAAIVAAVWTHEENHHLQGTAAAATDDPRKAIENLVGDSPDDLHDRVREAVSLVNVRIALATAAHKNLATWPVYMYIPPTTTAPGYWSLRSWPL